MGMYKYIRNLWKKPGEHIKELTRERLILWRRQPVTVRVEKPTRLDKARSLGYKAKQGFIVVRQRVQKGGRQRPTIRKGRRPKHNSQRLDLDMSYQQVAEARANKKYTNTEVLNSYEVGRDGKHLWYEIILIDTAHPVIKANKDIKWITESHQKGRVYRGLTSAGKKSRGLRKKGKGAEKLRPSRTANWKRRKA